MCANGRVGQAHTDLFMPSTNRFKELPLFTIEGTEFRVTTKRGYGSASVAVRAEKRATKNVKIIVLFSETETAKQNQKIPFHFFFRFAAEGWGEETREKCKEIFWFLHTRVRERVRGTLSRVTAQSERTRQFQVTTRSARAKWVRAKVNTSPQKFGIQISAKNMVGAKRRLFCTPPTKS